MLLQLIIIPAAASSLGFSGPLEVDVSGEDIYEMNFLSSEDVSSLSALIELPEGFSYSGSTELFWGSRKSSIQPKQSEKSLQWDLSQDLKSCRHIVINECHHENTG
jgi:hypothetical protein